MDWSLRDACAKARVKVRAARFKSGGEVRLLPDVRQKLHKTCILGLYDAVALYDDLYADELSGYVLIVWDGTGQSSVARRASPNGMPVGDALLPTYAAERLRSSLAEEDARTVVRRAFDLPDDPDEAS